VDKIDGQQSNDDLTPNDSNQLAKLGQGGGCVRELHLRQCALNERSSALLITNALIGNPNAVQIERLDLSQNRLSDEGSQALGSWITQMQANSQLRYLSLASTNMQSIYITRTINQLPMLTYLDLSNNPLDLPSVELLSTAADSSSCLKYLILSNCGLDEQTLDPIVDSFLTNTKLNATHLNISNNRITNECAMRVLAPAVQRSCNLDSLDLSGSRTLGFSGMQEICRAMTLTEAPIRTLILDAAIYASSRRRKKKKTLRD